jgi:uncharacterized repeat protein (TIGR02543 family)
MYLMTYIVDGKTIKAERVAYNKSLIPGPKKTGYAFTGWFTAKSKGTQVTQVTKSQTVYAQYKIRYYNVDYYDNNKLVEAVSVKYNSTVRGGPRKDGYIFKGWFTAKSGGTKITKITKSQTLYARYAKGVRLNVPLISQLPELPTGCEIVSVTQMLQYKGAKVNKTQLANEMPYHAFDPNKGYVGSPYNRSGWTIYPPALTALVNRYIGSSKNMTGASVATLKAQLDAKKPVVVWVGGMHGFGVHALVLTGYEGKTLYYNDCWTSQKNATMTQAYFESIWGLMGNRALSY